MTRELKIPQLGENVEEAQVVGVLVSAGDSVEKDQPVLEVETEKATLDVPADAAGTIGEVKVSEGDTVKVGQVIATLEGAEGAEDAEEAEEAEEEESEEKKEKEKGEKKEKAEKKQRAEAEEKELEDRKEEKAEEEGNKKKKKKEKKEEKKEPRGEAPPGQRTPVFAAPTVRQFARELGVDIEEVSGTGPGGRIAHDDVKRFVRERQAGKTAGTRAQAGPLPNFAQWGEVEREELGATRRKVAQHMALSWTTIPHVTLFQRADATDLEERRQSLKDRAEEAGAKLTVTAVLLKIVAAGLKIHPRLASSIDMGSGEIVRKSYCHIGVAVDTEYGLVVPVVRDVDRKNIIEIARDLEEAANKARDRSLKVEDMSGGCFSLTNLGALGTDYFTPLVNHPETSILGVGRAHRAPIFDDEKGEFLPRVLLPLSLSFDHRLIDGAEGARFLNWLVEAIEEPLLIQLEG